MSKLQEEYTETALDVREATGLDALEYATMQYEYGLAFLHEMLGVEKVVEAVSKSQHFWGWWKMQWMHRDVRYLDDRYVHVVNAQGKLERQVCAQKPYASYHAVGLLTTGKSGAIALVALRQIVGLMIGETKKSWTK